MIRLLADSPKIARLKSLDFGCGDEVTDDQNRIMANGLAILARSPNCPHLRSLSLKGNPVGDEAIDVILSVEAWSELKSLDLRSAGISKAGMQRLTESPLFASLRTLRFDDAD